ncbi:hypothetical protein BDD12DRAFT_806018 [Trichophaea hybrida]|nr:hypothetical protein BDD12DRAFT_806018 [Trichophaea hybrida]
MIGLSAVAKLWSYLSSSFHSIDNHHRFRSLNRASVFLPKERRPAKLVTTVGMQREQVDRSAFRFRPFRNHFRPASTIFRSLTVECRYTRLKKPGVAILGRRKAIVATFRSFEQFLLEGSAYIVIKFQRDRKQGLFLNTNLEHASKHLINHPDQKVETKAIAIALEQLYNQDLPREKWAELLEAYRNWFGLVSYPKLPGNTPNNSQIVRHPNREDSLCRFALTIPGAFSPDHYTPSHKSRSSWIAIPDQRIFNAPTFTETSTPELEEEEEVIPELLLINTPEESFETAPFTTPRLMAKPTAPDRKIFT